MSKHAKGNIVTKVLGLATVALIGGTAVATLLPSADFSGTNKVTGADVMQSLEAMVNPPPKVVAPTVVPVKQVHVKSIAATSTNASSTVIVATSTKAAAPQKSVSP